MDYKVMLTSFVAIFLAELGDKTQLSVLAFAGSGQSKLAVFAGASLALVLSTLLAVLLGEFAVKHLPAKAAHLGAGAMFVVIGVAIIYGELSK